MILPTMKRERELYGQGYQRIAGVDEVGRGPLAGPVVAAAVILPQRPKRKLTKSLRDSKLLSAKARERLDIEIREQAVAVGVGMVDVETIDRMGIAEASRDAMRRAMAGLSSQPDYALLDYVVKFRCDVPFVAIIDGDALCCSIAAASIVAKVHRDAMMRDLDTRYPNYGFAQHKGYSTPEHREALRVLGPTPIHRRSFFPIAQLTMDLDGATASVDEVAESWERS